MPTEGSVLDTVVLRYFLLVERVDLLVALLPEPRFVPAAVFDPDEQAGDREGLSEIAGSIRYQEDLVRDPRLDPAERAEAAERARRLSSLAAHIGLFEPTILAAGAEEDRFVHLSSRPVGDLLLPLGAGESACLAVGIERGVIVVTDDGDALRALRHLAPGHEYKRIRKLLKRAAEDGLCTKAEANALHAEMKSAGFWDKEAALFPPGKRTPKAAAKRRVGKRPPPRQR